MTKVFYFLQTATAIYIRCESANFGTVCNEETKKEKSFPRNLPQMQILNEYKQTKTTFINRKSRRGGLLQIQTQTQIQKYNY